MIQSIESFIGYFESIRRRTLNYIHALPGDRLGWSPKEGEFTCGDIIYHLIEVESMYMSVFVKGKWAFKQHEHHGQDNLEQMIADLEKGHLEAMATLRTMKDSDLLEPRPTPSNGPTIKAWRTLMMMVEHEVHHRSQLATYLALMGIQPPQIYGVTLEEVIAQMTS